MTPIRRAALLAAAIVTGTTSALAQTAAQAQPDARSGIPSSGVITPKGPTVDPGMRVKPPSTGGTMKVIKPRHGRPVPNGTVVPR